MAQVILWYTTIILYFYFFENSLTSWHYKKLQMHPEYALYFKNKNIHLDVGFESIYTWDPKPSRGLSEESQYRAEIWRDETETDFPLFTSLQTTRDQFSHLKTPWNFPSCCLACWSHAGWYKHCTTPYSNIIHLNIWASSPEGGCGILNKAIFAKNNLTTSRKSHYHALQQ